MANPAVKRESVVPLFISLESIAGLDDTTLKEVHACGKRMGLTVASENDPAAIWSDQLDHWWRVKQ